MKVPKSILYIAMSLDGFIAKPNDDLSFLSIVQIEGEDYGYKDFLDSVDSIVLGRKTYDWVIKQVGELQYMDKEVFVISKSDKPKNGNTIFYSGNLPDLISKLKNSSDKNIFIDGGAQLVNNLMKLDLIDEFIISIIPIFLGKGIRLFNEGIPERQLKLVSSKSFESGLVQIHYSKLL